MNQLMQMILNLSVSNKAAFAFAVFGALSKASNAISGGPDAMVDFAYQYLPGKYKEMATEDEVKAVVKSYMAAYQATEKIFQK
jgi:hypothetical protein